MAKLSEGVKILISACVGVVFLYALSSKYNPTMSITLAFLAGTFFGKLPIFSESFIH